MDPQALNVAISVTAVGLMVGSFMLLLNGGAMPLGSSFRTTIEPMLRSIRSGTSLSRPELADRTILAAIALAGLGAVFERPLVGVAMMGLLAWSRPFIRRATREENRLMAVAGSFSIDLVIGLYVPIVAAQMLLTNFFTATSLLSVTVALSWPAGGGQTIPGRSWRLAPVPVR